jgi:hypothetical protein
MAKERAAGRRQNKAERAGLPKKKNLVAKAARSAAAANDAAAGDADAAGAPPARWTAERRAAARLLPRRRAPEAPAGGEDAGGEDAPPAAAARRVPRASSPSQHGSHFGNGESAKVNDEWQTSAEAWAEVAPVLQKFRDCAVWQPFYYVRPLDWRSCSVLVSL